MSEEQDWKAVKAIYDDIEERATNATTSKECADLIEETKNAPPWFDKIWFIAGIGSKMRELKEMEDKNGYGRRLSGESEKNE